MRYCEMSASQKQDFVKRMKDSPQKEEIIRSIDRKIKEKQAVACLREVAVLDKKQAKKLLFYCNWDVESAVQLHFEMMGAA